MNKRSTATVGLVALAALLVSALSAGAQTRLSDKDVQQRMKNMNEDIKKFHSSFNTAVSKSSIRKTTQEKDAKNLVSNFQKQAESMYQAFKNTKKANPYLQNCLDTSNQIDRVMQSTQLDSSTVSQWQKIKSQLSDLGTALHMS